MVLPMDQSIIAKSTICEGSDNATTEVNIPVGDLGTINLFLCEKGKSKFSDPRSLGVRSLPELLLF